MITLGLALAGCGTAATSSPHTATTPTSSSTGSTNRSSGEITWKVTPSSDPTSCSLTDGETQVTVSAETHNVTRACDALQRGWAGDGQYWANGSLSTLGQNGVPVQFTIACGLASTTDDQHITVEIPADDSDQSLANGVCATIIGAGGWRQVQANTTTTPASSPPVTDPGGNHCSQENLNADGYCVPSSVTGPTYTDPAGYKCSPTNTNGTYCNSGPRTSGGPPPQIDCSRNPTNGHVMNLCWWAQNQPYNAAGSPKRPIPGSHDAIDAGRLFRLGCTWSTGRPDISGAAQVYTCR